MGGTVVASHRGPLRRGGDYEMCIASIMGAPALPSTTSTRRTTSTFLSVQLYPTCLLKVSRRRDETANREAASVPKRCRPASTTTKLSVEGLRNRATIA